MKLPENYNLEEQYNKLLIKLNEKYPELKQNKETETEKETETVSETNNEFKLPKGFYVTNAYSKPKLVYAINNANCRREMKMDMPEKYNLENFEFRCLKRFKLFLIVVKIKSFYIRNLVKL